VATIHYQTATSQQTSIPPVQQKYYCGQSTLLGHSQAYRLGKSMNISMISFKTNSGYKIPLTNSSADAQATQRSWDFNEGWFAEPVFLTGDYPATLKAYTSTFLRNLTQAEMQAINGSADIFAHDTYTSSFYYAPDDGIESCLLNSSNPLYPGCFNSSNTYPSEDGGWNIGYAADPGSPWLHKAT
jgi:beta-glucosidase